MPKIKLNGVWSWTALLLGIVAIACFADRHWWAGGGMIIAIIYSLYKAR